MTIQEDDYVILKGRLSRVSGVIDAGYKVIDALALIGKEYGEKVEGLTIGRPRLADFKKRFKRGPQVILEKDIGLIIAKTGLSKDDTVVEGGSGSGYLTTSLALVAKKVHSYDIERNHINIARRNLDKMNIKNVEFHNENLYEGATKADVYVLDVPEPWQVPLENLISGGFVVCYVPTVDQVQKLIENSPVKFEVVELIERNWQAQAGKLRPESSGVLHTAFLCFGRKR